MDTWITRGTGILAVLFTTRLTVWVLSSLNNQSLWLAIPFGMANLLLLITTILIVINNWTQKVPAEKRVSNGLEPTVGIIIPTRGEEPYIVMKTVESVFSQDYPANKMLVIVSDDAHNGALRAVLYKYRYDHPEMSEQLVYFDPPKNGSPERKGEAKSGNLNAVLAFLTKQPDIKYIETRDCDDLVGDSMFLRQCIGQLQSDPKLGFVQTKKTAAVSDGDPFNNLEPLFYGPMLQSRYAADAVFPCGSGVVFRRAAIEEIGGFPPWSVVEDVECGIELHSRGWRGMYLPITGSISQVSPEDMANVIKQRGTWALDTMRIFFWRNPGFEG